MASAGKWELKCWPGGHPVWFQLFYEGQKVAHGIHHQHLHDLHYAVSRAIVEARANLPDSHKHEMD